MKSIIEKRIEYLEARYKEILIQFDSVRQSDNFWIQMKSAQGIADVAGEIKTLKDLITSAGSEK